MLKRNNSFVLGGGNPQKRHYKGASDGLHYLENNIYKILNPKMKKVAFTLAEVLITLGIIGVVAVMVLPVLLNRLADKKYDVARKKVMVSLQQACRQLAANGELTSAKDAEDFVKNYLSQYLKIIQTCNNSDLKKCGILTDKNAIKVYKSSSRNELSAKRTMATVIKDLNPGMSSSHTVDPNSKSYGFVMANGYAVNLFYNPKCWGSSNLSSSEYRFSNYTHDYVCINVLYDMNGTAAPNYFGKDINFVTVLYPDIETFVVAPNIFDKNAESAKQTEASASCSKFGKGSVPLTFEDFAAMVYNRFLFEYDYGGTYWLAGKKGNFNVSSWGGYLGAYGSNSKFNVRCKKK